MAAIQTGRSRIVKPAANVGRVMADLVPGMLLGDVEAVLFGVGGDFLVLILGEALLVFFFPNVAEAFKKEEPEDVMLVIAGIDRAAVKI